MLRASHTHENVAQVLEYLIIILIIISSHQTPQAWHAHHIYPTSHLQVFENGAVTISTFPRCCLCSSYSINPISYHLIFSFVTANHKVDSAFSLRIIYSKTFVCWLFYGNFCVKCLLLWVGFNSSRGHFVQFYVEPYLFCLGI